MEEAKILKKTKVKGLHIFCTKCKIRVTDTCGLNNKSHYLCKNKDKHKYKLRVCIPGNKSSVITKLFDTRDENEVVIEAYKFRAELEKNNFRTTIIPSKSKIPSSITEAMAFYLAYLNNDTPHEQEHKTRTLNHIKEVERFFKYFGDYLKLNQLNINQILFVNLDRDLVGKFKSFLLDNKDFAAKTYNKVISQMRIFVNYIINEFNIAMKNPFEGFTSLNSEKEINIIPIDEFDKLIKIITPENGKKTYLNQSKTKTYTKSFYKPWIKYAFQLGLFTGRRREEFICIKFKDIMEDEHGKPTVIITEDYKVNRSKNISEKETKKTIRIPIIEPLQSLLIELGYEENKGKDMYILAPEETMKRETMKDFISKSFTHYYSQLNTGKKIEFSDLRKTYISYLYVEFGDKARLITKHSGIEVMLKHYIDEKVIKDLTIGFDPFKDNLQLNK